MAINKMKISLGPIQYFWSAKKVYDFYKQAEKWPVDIIYLGENVCAKRQELKLDDWLNIAEKLTLAGKEVVLSTMVLLEADSELSRLKRICNNENYNVEANDLSAVYLLKEIRNFVAGPHINMYNAETITLLSHLGAYRWVMPMELSAIALKDLLEKKPENLETEIFVYGHIPLSFSARCFTARKYNLPKDQCDFLCKQDIHGSALFTQESDKLFNINGIQLQSGVPSNLIGAIEQMHSLEIDVIRLSPQLTNMESIVTMFRKAIDKEINQNEIDSWLNESTGNKEWCNGYWYNQPGMNWYKEQQQKMNN